MKRSAGLSQAVAEYQAKVEASILGHREIADRWLALIRGAEREYPFLPVFEEELAPLDNESTLDFEKRRVAVRVAWVQKLKAIQVEMTMKSRLCASTTRRTPS